MRGKAAKTKVDAKPIRIAVLLNEKSSLGLAFLIAEIFQRANTVIGAARYCVEFVSANKAATTLQIQQLAVPVKQSRSGYDFLIAPPMSGVTAGHVPALADAQLVQRAHAQGTVIASACLGALTLAAAGLLDGRNATTHWGWVGNARKLYPAVQWQPARMIVDHGDVATAGGFLAAIDLSLSLVARTHSKDAAHSLGQVLLADSVRQKQSVYANKLIDVEVEHPSLSAVIRHIDRNLRTPLLAEDLAKRARMSLRSFHRKFFSVYGTTPRKYIQMKRIEKAQELLRKSSRSVEQIVAAVGVSDIASFRRVFRREIGYTPAEFRKHLARRTPLPAAPSHGRLTR